MGRPVVRNAQRSVHAAANGPARVHHLQALAGHPAVGFAALGVALLLMGGRAVFGLGRLA